MKEFLAESIKRYLKSDKKNKSFARLRMTKIIQQYQENENCYTTTKKRELSFVARVHVNVI